MIELQISQSILMVDLIPFDDLVALQEHIRVAVLNGLRSLGHGHIDYIDFSQQIDASEARIKALELLDKEIDDGG